MSKRILLAGLVGGVGLFFWGFLSHAVLGLGEIGMQFLPQEQSVVEPLKAAVPQPGLYYFPQEDAEGKIAPEKSGGPYGILIYHPTGASPMMTGQLVNELILNIIQALIAAYVLSLAGGLAGYASRVGLVLVLGVFSGIATNVEYWNWYGFPANYTMATIVDEIIGFLVVGLIAAAFVKPAAAMQGATAQAA